MHSTLLVIEKRNLFGECLKTFLKCHFADLRTVVLTNADQAASLPFPSVGCILTSDARDLDQLGRRFPEVPLMILEDARGERRSRIAGDVCVLSLDLPPETFVHALRAAFRDDPVVAQAATRWEPDVNRGIEAEPGGTVIGCLSEREHEVLAALRNGLSNKVIAGELKLSENTVKIHVRNVIRKLGATNRTMAALRGATLNGGAVAVT
jgi:DNA-binding NarL/FixJ family response regulator